MQKIIKKHQIICLAIVLISALSGCSSINPFATAQTSAQQVYALESTYNIVLEQVVKVAKSPTISQSTLQKILVAEHHATAIIESLSQAFKDYTLARIALAQGKTTEEKIAIVEANLEVWVAQAETAIAELAQIIENAASA